MLFVYYIKLFLHNNNKKITILALLSLHNSTRYVTFLGICQNSATNERSCTKAVCFTYVVSKYGCWTAMFGTNDAFLN